MKTETKPITIKLTKKMIQQIYDIIEETGMYANAPDFIVWSMRAYYDYILSFHSKVCEEVFNAELRSEIAQRGLNRERYIQDNLFLEYVSSVVLYGELGKQILIRVPIGFYHNIMKLNEIIGPPLKTIQDYCRHSVYYAIGYVQDRDGKYDFFYNLCDEQNTKPILEAMKNSDRLPPVIYRGR